MHKERGSKNVKCDTDFDDRILDFLHIYQHEIYNKM